jgi:arsenite-transporting ATPase
MTMRRPPVYIDGYQYSRQTAEEAIVPKISVFEPALCCNTGVCGEDVDPNLVGFSADMAWLTEQGATIARHNLANDPLAFAHDDVAKRFLEIAGSAGLPLVCVDGVTVLTGRYPSRAELAHWAGVETSAAAPAGAVTLGLSEASETACCPPGQSDCC